MAILHQQSLYQRSNREDHLHHHRNCEIFEKMSWVRGGVFWILLCVTLLRDCQGWRTRVPPRCHSDRTRCFLQQSPEQFSRRSFWVDVVGKSCSVVGLLGGAKAATAKGYAQENADKEKILKGYDRLTYLLDNWVAETTICGAGSDNPYIGCERNPMKVMEFLGYKSMDDPLFKADKTMLRLQALVPPEDEIDYLEAMEKWIENADEASGMAYVSSWGEANPGGGKDRVEYYIERSKNDVIEARNSLETVIRILKLKQ